MEQTTSRRLALLVSALASAISLFLLTSTKISNCPGSQLDLALWLAFAIHISTFLLILLPTLYLGFILTKLGSLLNVYYIFVVAAILSIQLIFYENQSSITRHTGTHPSTSTSLIPMTTTTTTTTIPLFNTTATGESQPNEQQQQQSDNQQQLVIVVHNCLSEAPLQYAWIAAQIVMFYLIVIGALARCGTQICKESGDSEEEEKKKEMVRDAIREYVRQNQQQQQLQSDEIPNDKAQPLLEGYKQPHQQQLSRKYQEDDYEQQKYQ